MDNNTLNNKKLELKIQSLKERFAKKLADTEDEIADIRADATIMYEQMSQRIAELEGDLAKDADVQEA